MHILKKVMEEKRQQGKGMPSLLIVLIVKDRHVVFVWHASWF